MAYRQYNPNPALTDYIDAYWIATGDAGKIQTEKILPDGCVDIILNLGADCRAENGSLTLQNEKTYLVGTMTRFKESSLNPESELLGIRFKPAAFLSFYKFASLHEITDQTLEFDEALSPDLKKTKTDGRNYLDQFFLAKLGKPNNQLLNIVTDIQNHKGLINVGLLAERHCTTVRQLERNFKQYIGVSPKEFLNLVRYQYTLPIIQNNNLGQSLAQIAFDCGYYDHAHLTNEIKKYTGEAPTKL